MTSAEAEPAPTQADWVDRLMVGIVVLVVGFAVAAYGAVRPWSELPLVVAAALLAVLCCVQVGRGRGARRLLAPTLILGSFAGLAAIQATALPQPVIAAVSPERLANEQAVEPAATSAPTAWLPLSYHPLATLHGLRLHLVGIAVFAAVGIAATDQRLANWLLLGLFGLGTAEAGLALAQNVTGATGIYWSDVAAGSLRSGSFVNYSNFSQFINLTIGAGIGLLLVRLSEDRARRQAYRLAEAMALEVVTANWWLFAGLALQAIAIAASLSRNGFIGMVVATLAVAAVMNRQQSLGWRSWLLLSVPTLAFLGGALVGLDETYDRLATLEERGTYADRWELGKASLRAAGDHFAAGVGLDAYQYVFPGYDTTGSVAIAEQADNDYAQLATETGIAGVAIVAAFLAWTTYAGYAVLTMRRASVRHPVCGVAYGLTAVAVQSLTDFGQRLPAVFCVTAALCGVCYAARESKASRETPHGRTRWALAGAMLLGVLPLAAWSIREAVIDYRADQWFAVAYGIEQQIDDRGYEPEPQDYADLVGAAERAVELRPGEVKYVFWLNSYRWRMVVDLSGVDEAVIAASPEGGELALQIADEFSKAKRLCVTFGPAFTMEGRLRLLAGDPSGAALVLRGAELNPNNPRAVLDAVRVQAATGDADEAAIATTMARVLSLDGSSFGEVATICTTLLDSPELALQLAGEDATRLASLARRFESSADYGAIAEEAAEKLARLKEARLLSGEATPGELASLAAARAEAGAHAEAIGLYRKALTAQYDALAWRLELIDSLVAEERFVEAEREARVCLRLRPGNARALKRLEEISLLVPADSGQATPGP